MIDFEKQKSKLHIIEQEFKQAERVEYLRQKEASAMQLLFDKRRRVWGGAVAVEHIWMRLIS